MQSANTRILEMVFEIALILIVVNTVAAYGSGNPSAPTLMYLDQDRVDELQPSVSPDGCGGFFAVWAARPDYVPANIVIQHVDAKGEAQFDIHGVTVTSIGHDDNWAPFAVADGLGEPDVPARVSVGDDLGKDHIDVELLRHWLGD